MNKKLKSLSVFIILAVLLVALLLGGCSSDSVPPLGGGYQSESVQGYIVQMAVQSDDNTFVEYIDNREVDRGVFEKKSDNNYSFKSDRQTFEITLSSDDSFEITIEQINESKPIELKNIDKVPTYFSTEFDDVEEYKELLNEK